MAVTPLISICLPNLNTRPFLQERMDTILKQTLTDWELIVCDSFSDDGSWEFFQQYRNDPRIHLHQVPREGIYAGWNECLRRATGRYIYIATSDDTMSPDALAKLVTPLERHPELDLSVCAFDLIDENSKVFAPWDPPVYTMYGEWARVPAIRSGLTEFLMHACRGTIWITMTSVLFRRRLLDKIGLFRLDRGVQADEEWSMRACLASDIAFVPERLATWRRHHKQATRDEDANESLRRTVGNLNSILADASAGIPSSWKELPMWQERIKACARSLYLESFHLNRTIFRQSPRKFFSGFRYALRWEPLWLIKQAVRLFPWPKVEPLSSEQWAAALIRELGAPWPPRELTPACDPSC